MVNFGERLKKLRVERKLTQIQLAQMIGVAVSAISSYEVGNRYPSYDVLISIARIFHVSTDYLLGLDPVPTIDVSGLSENEISIILQMINLLKTNKLNL